MNPTTIPTTLRLSKHHGAGNDFLVLVDREGASPIDASLARALCDRRYGIGADGVIRVFAGRNGTDLAMELRNADGTDAEMSGNGVRCLAQAVFDAGLVDGSTFRVETAAGVREVEYHDGPSATASVDMGRVVLGDESPVDAGELRALEVDVGNPHLVLRVDDPALVDVEGIGRRLQERFPGGVNVEFVTAGPGADALTLRVWERGSGETLACGTGSVAAAAAMRHWAEVGERVEVQSPGGQLVVQLEGDRAVLSGPVRKVADLVVEPRSVLAAART
jgi:diaminopimelate epimerase